MYIQQQPVRIEELLELNDEDITQHFTRIDKQKAYILIDRIVVKQFEEEDIHRISDSVGTAFYEGEGNMYLEVDGKELLPLVTNLSWMEFSLKSRYPIFSLLTIPLVHARCAKALDMVLGIDADLVIPDKKASVYDGAVAPWKGEKLGLWRERFVKAAARYNFPVHKALAELTEEQYELLWKAMAQYRALMIFLQK